MKVFTLLIIFSVFLFCGCEQEAPFQLESSTVVELKSPNGCCVAEVTELKTHRSESTGLGFDFTEYGGGFHAVSFKGVDLDLKLRQIDSENLEVRYPHGVPIYGARATRTDGITTIERVEFYERIVNIHFVPEQTNDDA